MTAGEVAATSGATGAGATGGGTGGPPGALVPVPADILTNTWRHASAHRGSLLSLYFLKETESAWKKTWWVSCETLHSSLQYLARGLGLQLNQTESCVLSTGERSDLNC
jgi:hypothetical protein